MTKHRLIMRKVKLMIAIWIIIPTTILGQSTWIYGIQSNGNSTPGYLVRLNYLNNQYDTLLYLGYQYIDDFGSCIDPYNGRLFLSGVLFDQDNYLHVVDLNTLEIVSYYKQGRDVRFMEYNLLNNSILYRVDSTFWRFDLETHVESKLSDLEHTNGQYYGYVSTYNPINNTHIHLGKGHNFINIDGFTGEVKSTVYADIILENLVLDFENGKHFGTNDETVYQFNPTSGEIIELLTIPGYKALANQQRGVYDQVNKKYIIPYAATDNQYKISVIDMESLTIDTTYIQPTVTMEYHQIYCQPRTNLSLINDTLYTSYGINYQWYINGFLDPYISTQHCIPYEYGDYQTLNEYPEYSSLSNTVSYLYTDFEQNTSASGITFSPNPFLDIVKVSGENVQLENSTLRIFSSIGELVHKSQIKNSEFLYLGFLNPGIYIFIIDSNGKHLIRKKMIKK